MKILKSIAVVPFVVFLYAANTPAEQSTQVFQSPVEQTTFIELYTSEGCSSCPPADNWISSLKADSRLWTEFVPVAFHVDYWDYIGWKDRFADARYSIRQRQYAQLGNASTVYTPGFFQNGREWRSWFGKRKITKTTNSAPGSIQATINTTGISVNFTSQSTMSSPLMLNVALLGFNLQSKVQNGENKGKVLTHDFVALNWHTVLSSQQSQTFHWQLDREVIQIDELSAEAIAIWISKPDDPTPLQATGGWLQ